VAQEFCARQVHCASIPFSMTLAIGKMHCVLIFNMACDVLQDWQSDAIERTVLTWSTTVLNTGGSKSKHPQ
jgi:hypothetical protein